MGYTHAHKLSTMANIVYADTMWKGYSNNSMDSIVVSHRKLMSAKLWKFIFFLFIDHLFDTFIISNIIVIAVPHSQWTLSEACYRSTKPINIWSRFHYPGFGIVVKTILFVSNWAALTESWVLRDMSHMAQLNIEYIYILNTYNHIFHPSSLHYSWFDKMIMIIHFHQIGTFSEFWSIHSLFSIITFSNWTEIHTAQQSYEISKKKTLIFHKISYRKVSILIYSNSSNIKLFV